VSCLAPWFTPKPTPTTNATGLATLEIGRGTPVTGSFATINWSTTPIFLKTEIDPAGGTAFVEMGTSELLSVPFALYAQNTANNDDADADPTNEFQTVSQQEGEVTLSHNGGSFIAGINSYSQTEINALTPYNGLTVHNATTNCINYYYLNNWFEACGTCTPQPSQAVAGPDQIGVDRITTTLQGNVPENGTGLWTIISGNGGSLGNPSNPNSTFTGVPNITYTLAWTVSTFCGSSVDEVNIRFWICGLPITDARDNKIYYTVQIGNQCWMAQNLNIGTRIDGIGEQTDNGLIEKYCCDNAESNCGVYGGLYQWNEMMGYSTTPGVPGICPEGWHLPTDDAWTALTNNLGGESVAGGKMKETGTTHWNSPNTGATNSSGFTGLPGGYCYNYGTFGWFGYAGYFWSSTQFSTSDAWGRSLGYNYALFYRDYDFKGNGFSVRCLKD